MTISERRVCSTETIHHIWDAIVFIRQQKQIPNCDRITNYMRRKHNITNSELEQQLELAVKDGLVDLRKRVGCKGSKVGVEQEAYRLPEGNIEKDNHDWYCFECHKGGEVLSCSSCCRVYHKSCLKKAPSDNEKLVCNLCNMLKSKDEIKIKRDDINLLLSFTCVRLKDKSRELHKMPFTNEEEWRYNSIIYEKMDLLTMEQKTQDNIYRRFEEFQSDAQLVVHNVVLYYGVLSPVADMARQMLRDCCYDLNEIRQCRDCYRTSNEKRDKFWFCQPCNPPHDLVFAKQKGFPYWPAKVIRIEDGMHDVRFFGALHQRALIDKVYIKPIKTSLQQMQLKRSAALNKALDELKRHQQLIGQSPIKEKTSPVPPKEKAKRGPKPRSRPASSSSSRSGSASRSRSRKSSVSSEEVVSENEADKASRDEPTSSSPKIPRFKDAPTPDDHNVVSSSSQESPNPKVTVSTQTHKKLLASLLPPQPEKVEEKEIPTIPPCDCESKYSKMFKEFKERVDKEYKDDKERSLRELAERLRKDFEEEKQKLVNTALENLQQEVEETKRKSEDDVRQAQQVEINELMDRHRMDVSETKKKQWCYNCEQEAIYHCCWNTSYCSVDCQQVHWHKEHKRTCRRKR